MSNMTGRQRYFAFSEWLNWAQHNYSSMKKKKKAPAPTYTDYNNK